MLMTLKEFIIVSFDVVDLYTHAGRTVRVHVRKNDISYLLRLAVDVSFDWVVYDSLQYVRLSVIPDGK